MIVYREDGEVFLASCKELVEIYKLSILRDGKIYLHVTSGKDKGGKALLGGIKLPKNVKDIPNGSFSLEALNWFFKGLNLNASYIKVINQSKCECYLVMNDGREFVKSFGLRWDITSYGARSIDHAPLPLSLVRETSDQLVSLQDLFGHEHFGFEGDSALDYEIFATWFCH